MQKKNDKLKRFNEKFKNIVVPVIAYGGIAGILSGILVGLFNFVARYLIAYSQKIYQLVLENLWAIPLFFLGLVAMALLMALLHKYVPNLRGSGIPNVEGSVRGYLSYKSGRTLFGTFAGAFLSYFAGLPLGSEGPSVQIGAMTSQGVTNMLKAKLTWQKYIMAGGAGAGIAVAFNAPLTGIIFALEECHKRLSPIVLLCSSSAVFFGTATFRILGMIIKDAKWSSTVMLFDIEGLIPLGQLKDMSEFGQFAGVVGMLCVLGIVVGLFAVVFNVVFVKSQRFMDRFVKKFPYPARLVLAFVLTGILGLIFTKFFQNGFSFVNTGGHSIIEVLCHHGLEYSVWLILLILAVRFILTLLCFNSGATGGLFIPMLAIGALVGAFMGKIFVALGMSESYFPAVVLIAMTTFFSASVRAPITAIVLIVELSGYDSDFLPTIIAIFTAFLVAELTGNMPFYDSLLDRLREQSGESYAVKRSFATIIDDGAFVVGRRIKDIIWPANGLVTEIIKPDGEGIVPDGETTLESGDKITVVVESTNYEKTVNFLNGLLRNEDIQTADKETKDSQD